MEKIGKYQLNYIRQYEKTNLDNIETINGVPKVVFVIWFGHTETTPMFTVRRYHALQSLISNIGVPVIMITQENYKNFEKRDYPYHPAFNYLSGVHKSDYIRTYLLYHYGGGYHDIKFREESWKDEWEKFKDANISIIGRREKSQDVIVGDINIKQNYDNFITMGWIICRPYINYTEKMLETIENILTKNFEKLKQFPAPEPRYIKPDDDENAYPLKYNELLTPHMYHLQTENKDHIEYTLPDALKKTYK